MINKQGQINTQDSKKRISLEVIRMPTEYPNCIGSGRRGDMWLDTGKVYLVKHSGWRWARGRFKTEPYNCTEFVYRENGYFYREKDESIISLFPRWPIEFIEDSTFLKFDTTLPFYSKKGMQTPCYFEGYFAKRLFNMKESYEELDKFLREVGL